jgi:hypothetical protein
MQQSIFNTIADRNFSNAAGFCSANGYQVQDADDVSQALQMLVSDSDNPQSAFIEVMKLHPDREAIVDIYASQLDTPCCSGCNNKCKDVVTKRSLPVGIASSADGTKTYISNAAERAYDSMFSKTGVFVLVSAILISIAIFASKNNN